MPSRQARWLTGPISTARRQAASRWTWRSTTSSRPRHPGSGRRTGCTDMRRGAPRGISATEAAASRPCAGPLPVHPRPVRLSAAAPVMAASADTAAASGLGASNSSGNGQENPGFPRPPDVAADRGVGDLENGRDLPVAPAESVLQPENISNLVHGQPLPGHRPPPRSKISREVGRTVPGIRSSSTLPCPLYSGARSLRSRRIRMLDIRRNRWTLCVGIGGRNESESVSIGDHSVGRQPGRRRIRPSATRMRPKCSVRPSPISGHLDKWLLRARGMMSTPPAIDIRPHIGGHYGAVKVGDIRLERLRGSRGAFARPRGDLFRARRECVRRTARDRGRTGVPPGRMVATRSPGRRAPGVSVGACCRPDS